MEDGSDESGATDAPDDGPPDTDSEDEELGVEKHEESARVVLDTSEEDLMDYELSVRLEPKPCGVRLTD